MKNPETINRILNSRALLRPDDNTQINIGFSPEAEGGCGVIGMASSVQVAGRHMLQALDQMRNRGNGKGGGIAAVGLDPMDFGTTQEILDQDYLLAVAYLETDCREEVEQNYLYPTFDIDHIFEQPHIADFTSLRGLDIQPPQVVIYFAKIKTEVREEFCTKHNFQSLTLRQLDDEIVYQNTFRLNTAFYSSTGKTRAFVLSHGKNLLILKMVGYGDDVIRYYKLEDVKAHVWIGHHRYPTKGRVWHPGGAHPFIGMNEALVHNGDFANYSSISEYLSQRNIYPLFLTDTEVSVQVFDLLRRTYGYPLEYVIEALAPTTERDFTLLPTEKQKIYQMLQTTHIHSSPDGPWFFLIAQSEEENSTPVYRLTCITDTSMLRPQVFAWQQHSPDGPSIGFAASEKQGIDAALASLAESDHRFWSRADRYWNARGGSHTDGGAFIFSVRPNIHSNECANLECTDKFGTQILVDSSTSPHKHLESSHGLTSNFSLPFEKVTYRWVQRELRSWEYQDVLAFLEALENAITDETSFRHSLDILTGLMNNRSNTGKLRPSSLLSLYDSSLSHMVTRLAENKVNNIHFVHTPNQLPVCTSPQQTVVIDARAFDPEGPDSLAYALNRLYKNGFKGFIITHTRGHRFIGNGFGPETPDVRMDVYGSPGDYLGSGADGMQIYVHTNAQDQAAQIMKSGKLVVYGDVGQTFMYGAKGGEAYILGNAAGRPLINAVGKPRVVINGTCLDYLAESFMAGDPLNGGGFVILNGIQINQDGQIVELDTPYPGGNLFSLASGGAIFVRDPYHRVTTDQLNGGEFSPLTESDWSLIRPYLEENEHLFDIPIATLLSVGGEQKHPSEIYRKIRPIQVRALQAEEAWIHTN